MSSDRMHVLIASLKSECDVSPNVKEQLVQNPVRELRNRGLTLDEMIQFYDLNGLSSIIGQDNISSIIGQDNVSSIIGQDNISSTTEQKITPSIIGQQC
jgi:hypothetical protein